MRLRRSAAWLAVAAFAAACVEVPSTIKADFAPPGPGDRSNYRPGAHGTATAAEPPAPKLAHGADADAGASHGEPDGRSQ
jgi:hypothetical protein